MHAATHPLNLLLRFGLELVALYALGRWGLRTGSGALRFALALGLPLLAALVWGVFAVPGDPSRSGRAPIPVPGAARLVLELLFFALGALAFVGSEARSWGIALAGLTLVHYALSLDRIRWLLAR